METQLKGATGFDSVQYDPKTIGDAMGKFLFREEETSQVGDYLTEVYPKVMVFFKENDLQPTVENIKLNCKAIRESVGIDAIQTRGALPNGGVKKKKPCWICIIILVIVIYLIYRYNS